jgi:type IV pilus assembly protein PilC
MFNRISNKEIIEVIRTLSMLLYSRISVTNSIELLVKQTKNAKLKAILKSILKDIKSGNSISKSFAKYPRLFSDIFIANLRVAEETGQIAEVLNEYTDYLEKVLNLKRKIIQAVRYPILVLVVAGFVMFFMLFYIIPTFQGLFSSVKAPLPEMTKFLMNISNFAVNNNILLIFIVLIIIFLAVIIVRNDVLKGKLLDIIIWKIPFLSKIYRDNLLARFSVSMGILLKSRVSLTEALKISKDISGNETFKQQVDIILKKIIKGESLSANLQNLSLFDITFSRLLAVGEESAELDKVFNMMGNYYSSEFDYYLDNITSLLEPVLILLVGGIVAFILIALYLPMFDIINYFGV